MKKLTICDILAKQLASNFRQKHPDLRIEGHPAQSTSYSFIPYSRLIINDHSRSFLLQFHFLHRADTIIVVRVNINANRKIIQLSKMRKAQTYELSNPDSIDDLERWIKLHIKLCTTNSFEHLGKDSPDTP